MTRDRVRRSLLGAGLAALVGCAVLVAQAPPPPAASPPTAAAPTLAELDRVKLINASLQVENWQLKLQQAASELQRAREEFARQVAAVTPEGWQLTDKLEFVKKEK